jgi:hypothetical protein
MISRRQFIDTLAMGTAAVAINSTAKSYGQILGSNERVNFAVIGLNGRAQAHLSSLKANEKNAKITHVCDVESTIMQKFAAKTEKTMGSAPVSDKDFRKTLASKDVDAITIATPDHWHAPMAIAGLQAGKHVYVEKPCSHNPAEGALLVEAQKKYGKLVQMGTQRRSSQMYIDIIGKIQGGLVGNPYYARAWYSNTRKAIGTGKVATPEIAADAHRAIRVMRRHEHHRPPKVRVLHRGMRQQQRTGNALLGGLAAFAHGGRRGYSFRILTPASARSGATSGSLA